MSIIGNYTNCKVIIHDDKRDKTIAETIVLDYDRDVFTITVYDHFFTHKSYDSLSLLILYRNSVYEFKGTLRRLRGAGQREIALFQGHTKEDRISIRYDVNAPAKILNLLISNKPFALRKPLEVVAINISTEGVLLKGRIGAFNIGTAFQLILDMGGSETILDTSVVRIGKIDENNAEYGCKFIKTTAIN